MIEHGFVSLSLSISGKGKSDSKTDGRSESESQSKSKRNRNVVRIAARWMRRQMPEQRRKEGKHNVVDYVSYCLMSNVNN